MKRRYFLKAAGLSMVAGLSPIYGREHFFTDWRVTAQQGLDACLLMGVLSAPSMQAEAYPIERNYWHEKLESNVIDALAHLRRAADQQNALLGPFLALLASAASTKKIEDSIAAFENPDRIKPGLISSEFWGGESEWQDLTTLFPDVVNVLRNIQRKGFSEYWNTQKLPKIKAKIDVLSAELKKLDLIALQQKYLGRRLKPRIDIFLSGFSEPHGIRIIGQRFLTSFDYPTDIVKRNAAHEIFHPVLLDQSVETKKIIKVMSNEVLLKNVVARSAKKYGYSSIPGLVEEGIVQALEAIVLEQTNFPRESQAIYWREQDDGIHIFAAAAHHLMHTSGFAKTGGDALHWLAQQTESGQLIGNKLRQNVIDALGVEGIKRWL